MSTSAKDIQFELSARVQMDFDKARRHTRSDDVLSLLVLKKFFTAQEDISRFDQVRNRAKDTKKER
eukprot:2107499-Amphidinium_carterae.1